MGCRHQLREGPLPEHNLRELRDLLEILTTQRRMGRKYLERFVGKLRSIHLAVSGAVAHLYHIQRALSQAGTDKAWLFPEFYRNIADFRMLAEQTASRPPTMPRSSVANPPIWSSSTCQDYGAEECG